MSQTTQGSTVMVQGRIVWVAGDLFKGQQKTDQNTRRPLTNDRGEPLIQYGFGLAVPKSVLNQTGPGQPGEIWAVMYKEALSLYPSGQIPPQFAMKFKDGEGIDHNGVPFAQREGYAGHIVLSCTTSIPIKFFKYENGQNFLVSEGIKCGDYVNVQLSVKAHPAVGQGKPGLYLNPNAVQLVGYGKEIINTPSGDSIFGNQAPPVPQGASSTPVAPAGMLVPPSMAAQPQAPQMPAAPPAPHYGVLPPVHQPPQQAPMGNVMPQMPQGFSQQSQPQSTPNGFSMPSTGMPSAPPVPQQGFAQPAGMPPVPGFPQMGQPAMPAFPSNQPAGFPAPFPGQR
jgi:hypothetical protein